MINFLKRLIRPADKVPLMFLCLDRDSPPFVVDALRKHYDPCRGDLLAFGIDMFDKSLYDYAWERFWVALTVPSAEELIDKIRWADDSRATRITNVFWMLGVDDASRGEYDNIYKWGHEINVLADRYGFRIHGGLSFELARWGFNIRQMTQFVDTFFFWYDPIEDRHLGYDKFLEFVPGATSDINSLGLGVDIGLIVDLPRDRSEMIPTLKTVYRFANQLDTFALKVDDGGDPEHVREMLTKTIGALRWG